MTEPLAKRKFVKLTYRHVGSVVLEENEVGPWLRESEEPPIKTEIVFLTDAQYEALPEFES